MEERVLLVINDNPNSQEFKKQIKAFQNQQAEINDRRIINYHITTSPYRIGLSEEHKWIKT